MNRKERNALNKKQAPLGRVPSGLPILPPIPESIINWKGVEWCKNEESIRDRYHWYAGPVEPGMIFAWEPDLPHARMLLIVVAVTDPLPPERVVHGKGVAYLSNGTEPQVWATTLNSPYRGMPFKPHVAPQLFKGHPIPNDISRWREACIPTTMHPQTP